MALQGILTAAADAAPLWDIVFLSEVDHRLDFVQSLEVPEGTLAFRHRPGPGSWAMAFIISPRNRQFLREHMWHVRVGQYTCISRQEISYQA